MSEKTQTSKLFQIYEDDLATLEQVLPELLLVAYPTLDNTQRSKWRQVQRILSQVRWDYGPPGHVEVIRCDPENPPDGPSGMPGVPGDAGDV